MFIQTTTKYRAQKLCPFTPAIIAIVCGGFMCSHFHDVSNNGCEKIGGCIINYRKILKRYLFKTHDRWHECYSINKTSIRKNYSGVTEIVELKSK